MWRGNTVVTQIRCDRTAIDAWIPAGACAQRLKLRAEEEKSAEFGPVDRLDAEAISNKRQRAFSAIPDGDREHADEPVDGGLDPERGHGLEHDLRVGMSTK